MKNVGDYMTAVQGSKEMAIYVSPPNKEIIAVSSDGINKQFGGLFQRLVKLKEKELKKRPEKRDVGAMERHLEVIKEDISYAFPFQKQEVDFLIRTYLPFTSQVEDKPLYLSSKIATVYERHEEFLQKRTYPEGTYFSLSEQEKKNVIQSLSHSINKFCDEASRRIFYKSGIQELMEPFKEMHPKLREYVLRDDTQLSEEKKIDFAKTALDEFVLSMKTPSKNPSIEEKKSSSIEKQILLKNLRAIYGTFQRVILQNYAPLEEGEKASSARKILDDWSVDLENYLVAFSQKYVGYKPGDTLRTVENTYYPIGSWATKSYEKLAKKHKETLAKDILELFIPAIQKRLSDYAKKHTHTTTRERRVTIHHFVEKDFYKPLSEKWGIDISDKDPISLYSTEGRVNPDNTLVYEEHFELVALAAKRLFRTLNKQNLIHLWRIDTNGADYLLV